MIQQSEQLLKTVFGYDSFRPLQREVIAHILEKKDTLVILPTGGGKSLCYQIPALLFSGLTVVVSPLISLMKDQVEQLRAVGVQAAYLNSSLSQEEYRANRQLVSRGVAKLLYLAPESLLQERILTWLASECTVELLTIDEAHCISEWGHDFRPEYRQIAHVRSRFPGAVCAALTATATPRVQKDIIANLAFDASSEFIGSFNRENLFLEVVAKEEPFLQTVEFVRKFPDQSGIIYCFSRKQVDELYEDLSAQGFSVKPYHAGLSEKERTDNQELFIRDDVSIMVATIAFGMGINKPNVRFVVHHDLPKNIESYYQEIGRAGRDGDPAHCLLLFSYGDRQKINYFISQKSGREQAIAAAHLDALVAYAEGYGCRREPLLSYFGEAYADAPCNACDNCCNGEEALVDLTPYAKLFLTCMHESGEMFGAGHIIDILTGANTQKIRKFSHQTLASYAAGKVYAKKQWFMLSRQLAQQALFAEDAKYRTLRLTDVGLAVLSDARAVMGVAPAEERKTAKVVVDRGVPDDECDRSLFDLLRKKRKFLADRENVPPYVIFPDRTLREMAYYFPHSAASLLTMHGVGVGKGDRYGSFFLDEIVSYCRARKIEERAKRVSLSRVSNKRKKYMLVAEAYKKGASIDELMCTYDVQQSTILGHLLTYVKDGNFLDTEPIRALSALPIAEQRKVWKVLKQVGVQTLRSAFEALDEKISYDELKLFQICVLAHNNQ